MFGKKKKRLEEYDDGRTIASMNVDGMPGYNPGRIDLPEPMQPTIGEDGETLLQAKHRPEPEPLRGKELRRVMLSATLAGLAIALVFVLGGFLFIEFCLHVWLRG